MPIRANNIFTPVPKSKFALQDFLSDVIQTDFNEVGVYQLPGPKSSEGDDTYLISADGKSIGVFDGIGGNYEIGINPRDYSYSLMTGCRIAVNDKHITDPLQVLEEGFNFASKVSGSSAAIVGHLEDTEDMMYLNVINVGDSQFMVLRKNEENNVFSIVMKSEPQYDTSVVTWSNLPCPYQLTGNEERSDKPDVGVRYHIPIFDGDVIIMASDGLYDNLFDSESIGIVNECHNQPAQEIAKRLTLAAYVNSKDKTKLSPFSKTIGKLIGYEIGGKEDDITTVVMKISFRPMI
jgi:protein phosphatase PTC7